MSTAYVTEPPTKGKVILQTTLGDFEIELWPKEAPKAVRNFVQLCMEGFYHNTIFHRVISGFMAQGGDPTGTGEGSDSAYGGKPFQDEFHSRLRFSHRGLLACANQNEPHTNSCQFFITLDACDFLFKKNTIFGKIVGDTIYNVQRMNDLEVDANDRPLDPPMVTGVEIAWNPFDDIVPRTTIEERRAEAEAVQARKPKKKKAKKALNLLSFGDDAAEEDQELTKMSSSKIKSAHDAVEDARLLRDDDAEALELKQREEEEHLKRKARNAVKDALSKDKRAEEEDAPAKMTMEDRLRAKVKAGKAPGKDAGRGNVEMAESDAEEDEKPEEIADLEMERKAEEKRRQREFRQQLRDRKEELADKRGAAPMRPDREVADAELLTTWQLGRAKYKQKKRLTGAREKDTLAKLATFKSKIAHVPAPNEGGGAATDKQSEAAAEEGVGVAYDGKVNKDIDHKTYMPAAWRIDDYLGVEDDDVGIDDLRSHKLAFSKSGKKDDMARTENLDDYVVLDPLVEKQKEKFNKVLQRNKKRQNEWAGRAND